MAVRVLREDDVRGLVGMVDALAAVEQSLLEQARGTGINMPRHRVHQPAGVLHMMGGALLEQGYWGFKAYTATRQGVRFVVNLYDAQSGVLLALIEADYLGQIRTGAASGVATRYLARDDAATLGLLGAGFQAETQLEAVAAVRQLRQVLVYSRTAERRADFAQRMGERLGLAVVPVESASAAVAQADIVTTATTAREPVFAGKELAAGVHINAAGSNSLARAELDRSCIARASHIFTDDLEQARMESGDLMTAYERNALVWSQVRPLADVVAGLLPGRTAADDITLFESHGIALWDIALAATVYERAEAAQVGSMLEFGG